MLGTAAIRGSAIVVAVVSMPAYLRFFPSAPTLGVWFTILTVTGWMLTLDLGVGNGMRNIVATAIGEARREDLRTTISAGYLVSALVALVMAAGALFLIPVVPLNAFFNVAATDLSPQTLNRVALITFGAVIGQMLLRNVGSLLLALQRPVLNSVLPLVTSLSMLGAVVLMNPSDQERDIVRLAVVYLAASCVPYVLATLFVFLGPLRDARPRLASVNREALRNVSWLGGGFFAINIMYMALVTTDTPLITWLVGPAAVVEYQVYYRPFFLIASLFVMALVPVWSAVTTAWAQGDIGWVHRTYIRTLWFALTASAATLLVLLFLQPLVDLWLGEESIQVHWKIGLAFVAFAAVTMLNSVLTNVVSGIGNIKFQVLGYGAGVALKIPLALALVPALGWVGVVWAGSAAVGVYCLVMTWWVRGALATRSRDTSDTLA
jgi:O-antigen/teichoic acid export membrane protein